MILDKIAALFGYGPEDDENERGVERRPSGAALANVRTQLDRVQDEMVRLDAEVRQAELDMQTRGLADPSPRPSGSEGQAQ